MPGKQARIQDFLARRAVILPLPTICIVTNTDHTAASSEYARNLTMFAGVKPTAFNIKKLLHEILKLSLRSKEI